MSQPSRKERPESEGAADAGHEGVAEAGHIDPDLVPGDAERTLEREEERGVPRADHEPDVAEREKK